MPDSAYQEPFEVLSKDARNMHRAIVSLMEELQAIDSYNQRAELSGDVELTEIITHNRDEEKEHAAMLLEWIRRKDPKFAKELQERMFKKTPTAHP
jgi:hypothetical protein